MRRLLLALLSVTAVAWAIVPATASASSGPPPDTEPAMFLAPNGNQAPRGFAIDPNQAIARAETAPKMVAIHRTHHPLRIAAYVWVGSHYEIYFYYHDKVIADQIIGPAGQIGATYTGPLILGIYGRGHYGGIFDSPILLAAFTLMFLLPLLLLRGRSWFDRVRHRRGADVRRFVFPVRQRPPGAGGVDVLSAAGLPAGPDADPRLPAARSARHGSISACLRRYWWSACSRLWSRGS